MSFDTSWDVDKHKYNHEIDMHWHYRRTFLMAHKNKYPEDRLVCLSQTFINIEFLGCKYNQQTMDLIADLSNCIVSDLRKKPDQTQTNFTKPSSPLEVNLERDHQAETMKSIYTLNDPDYFLPGFMLIERDNEDHSQVFDRSCAFSGIAKPVIKFIETEANDRTKFKCEFYLKNKLIATGNGSTKKLSRKDVIKKAYGVLKTNCFTATMKDDDDVKQIMLIDLKDFVTFSRETSEDDEINSNIIDSGIGYNILKTMGWKDGLGLGKHGQGCIEPIQIAQLPKHYGFGNKKKSIHDVNVKEKMMLREINKYIRLFMKSPKQKLSFSTEFTKDERQAIHLSCIHCGLKTKSIGQGETKTIVLSKKQNTQSIFEELINISGNENDYYSLIIPKILKM